MAFSARLQADRMLATFTFDPWRLGHSLFQVHLSVDPAVCEMDVVSTEGAISVDDLQRLIGYFRDHVQQLHRNPNHESDVFTDENLVFQTQAFCGDIDDDGGDFTLSLHVNPAGHSRGHARIYVGGCTGIDVQAVDIFLRSLEEHYQSCH
ncbi:MAG: hypothetical protein N2C14_19775 [Planctomycetales bacterium]